MNSYNVLYTFLHTPSILRTRCHYTRNEFLQCCQDRKMGISMLQTGVVQRHDVSILYYITILTSLHNIITKDTSCYNKSISRLGLGAEQVMQMHYLNSRNGQNNCMIVVLETGRLSRTIVKWSRSFDTYHVWIRRETWVNMNLH